ncbi:WASH complex subunit 2 [Drosophila serrata]|uniref:WASH complex subunit 2 n=1 Tax=Drosophila serrata TaxID=7274 RepID=UPI000A1CF9FD|nr:WASH complex subunit 2 [Drosophila serrata]
MDISADVDRIIAQAPDWNLAGDCDLLALMKRISENLYERGERTSRNLQEFETSVRQVDISLSNATNSLRSLQFGHQFVEYRVEEVDDADLAMPEEKKKKPDPPPMSSEEMAKGFLDNNLRMFRKNFEPVTIDVPDSDDEDAPVSSTTVFRAKNPYDAIPLPYIIGTKEWEEHKYAGLYDSGENSGDDKSDEFSSSSSDEKEPVSKGSTQPENKFVEPHLSDSSSLASYAREPEIVSPVKTHNPAPVVTSPVPPAPAPAGQVPEAAIRTQPRPIISSQRNPHERDMFAALRQSPPSDDPPSTSSSPTSSPAFRNTSGGRLPIASTASLSSSSSSPAHQPPPRLFEDVEAVVPTHPSKEIAAKPGQIKRKPVNLFNDDEFNSFMSEIVDKVQAKAGAAETSSVREPPKEKRPTEPTAKQEAPLQRKNPAVVPQTVPRRVNLFDDSPPLSPSSKPKPFSNNAPSVGGIPKQTPPKEVQADQPKAFIAPKEPAKTLPKSLFDDDLEDDDFLSSLAPKSKPVDQKQSSKPKTSLFDDDDLDINDIFTKPTSANTNKLSERVAGKTSLFDDDDQEDDADLFGSKKPLKATQSESTVKKVEPTETPKKSLFDDIEEEDLFGTPKASARYNESQALETDVEIKEQSKHIEIEPETLRKQEITIQQEQELSNASSPPVFRESPPPIESFEATEQEEKNINGGETPPKPPAKLPNLFVEDFSDEDPFLESLNVTTKPKGASETNEFIKTVVKSDEKIKEVDKSPAETLRKSSNKHSDLFSEDSSDDDRLLSISSKAKDVPLGEKDTMKLIKTDEDHLEEIKPNKDQLVEEIYPKELPHKLPQEVLPENKIDDELNVMTRASAEVVVPVSETPPPDDHQSHQDPIIKMVADITNKSPKDDASKRKPADLAAAQQIMQNYSSLFSDEPPDDSEFFQTLGSSSSGLSSLSASKIFDNEHDFFEPALPKIPSATKSSAATPGDQPSATSDYGGIRLFSDVPPEDEDDIDELSSSAVKQPEDVAPPTTTRIHTIFYDDFSETARAGSIEPSHQPSSYDEEPPPSGDELDRSKAKETLDSQNRSSPIKKLKMPNININVQALLPGSGGGLPKLLKKQDLSSFEERHPAESSQRVTSPESIRKPTNIQPAEGGLQHVNKTRARGPAKRRPSTRKGRQENYVKSLIEDEQKPPHAALTQVQPSVESFLESPDNESQPLPFSKPVAVGEVSAPPSTVSASRQKVSPPKAKNSFLDSPDDDDSLFGPVTTKTVSSAKQNAGIMPVTATPVSAALTPNKPPEDRRQSVIPRKNNDPPASYRSFLDSPDEDDSLFSSADKNTTSVSKNSAEKTLIPPKVANTFLDSSDDDDFLFSPAKTPIAQSKSIVPVQEKHRDTAVPASSMLPRTEEPSKEQIKPKAQAVPKLFDDSDDDDDLFASAAVPAPLPSSSRPVQAKQPPKPAASSLFSSDEDDAKAPDNTLPKKKLPIKPAKSLFSDDDDDDDDLFGGGGIRKASTARQAQKTKPKAQTVSKPAASKTPTATATIPDSISDNPLADLLDVE